MHVTLIELLQRRLVAMIMPPDHARTLLVPRRLSSREKWILGGVSGLLVALVAVVVISLSSSGHTSANGCVDVALPYSTGGAEIYRCGDSARAMCRSVGVSGGLNGSAGRAVAAECRKAGLPVG
jgi:hypothetical protein